MRVKISGLVVLAILQTVPLSVGQGANRLKNPQPEFRFQPRAASLFALNRPSPLGSPLFDFGSRLSGRVPPFAARRVPG